ncbi:MAG: TolC family protein, partial [Dechloromonas sp.]|nr:TolC family protein [Dechloromonas sp.]
LEQDRLQREIVALRGQLAAAETQVAAATQRAALARDNRGFYEKSFRLGESDLPTRLRIEAEAFEAERALGSARIGRERTLSQLRQALGLLPE